MDKIDPYPLSIKEWPEEERPRERLLTFGPESLTDAELLAIILRTGGTGTTALDHARILLARYGSLRGLGSASCSELAQIKGIGKAKAAQVMACMEIARRFASQRIKEGEQFNSSRDVFEHFHEQLRGKKKEVFIALLLNGKNRKIREVVISEGSLNASIVHPREVFNPAVKDSAASIILVHNHPSGDPSPSREDREITARLKGVGELLGIRILDHLVIGDGRYISFADEGWL